MNIAEYFKENKYIYLSNVVKKTDAHRLTDYMFKLYDDGKLSKDPQCPLSDSVYGDPVLDELLQSLAKPLSAQLGIELLPTYTYARIYRPGEELVRHIDREACEISGTMTLGFDPGSGIWPIFMTDKEDDVVGNSLEISTGDLVMYHGNELWHWRPPYKGQWQVQVFFHFVDANGPHKDWANDKRAELGTEKSAPKAQNTERSVEPDRPQIQQAVFDTQLKSSVITGSYVISTDDGNLPCFVNICDQFYPEMAFTKQECQSIIALADKLYPIVASVGADEERVVDKKIRSVDLYGIDLTSDTLWIFDKIGAAVGRANAEHYGYNLTGITHSLQLLHYKATDNGHYDWHADVGRGTSSTRKISVSIPLSDPSDYEGGELNVNDNGMIKTATKQQGSIGMFPSFMLHQVAPVTKGERWSLVIWINGPRFR